MVYKKGHSGYWKGKERDVETKIKVSKFFKGKTYEQIMGEDGAKTRKRDHSLKMTGKGNPFFNKKHSKDMKKRLSLLKLGKTHEEIMGKDNAEKWHKRMSGENSPCWNGGYSVKDYRNFTNLFKRKVRKRDNYICMMCGKHQEKLKYPLSIHHIDYNKQNTLPQNCISLCLECHPKTNFNRLDWIPFFQGKLSKYYGYKYSDKNEVIIEYV